LERQPLTGNCQVETMEQVTNLHHYESIPEVLLSPEGDAMSSSNARQSGALRGRTVVFFAGVTIAAISVAVGVGIERNRKGVSLVPVDEDIDEWDYGGIPILKKHHHKKDKNEKHQQDNENGHDQCFDGTYSKTTLKTAFDMPFAALFEDTRGQKKFEASDVIQVGDYMYAICDNSWAISRFHKSLTPFDPANIQIGDPNRDPLEESGYEAIFHDEGVFYLVRESVAHYAMEEEEEDEDALVIDGGDFAHEISSSGSPAEPCYHAVVDEVVLTENNTDYEVTSQCSCEYEFEGSSKGFEGAVGVRDTDDELVMLGLCEGNHCSEKNKFDRGHGKLIAMKKNTTSLTIGNVTDVSCVWRTVAEIDLPKSANFLDYSAIAMTKDGRVAVTSQEDSMVWLGKMTGFDDMGRLDLKIASFDPLNFSVFSFAKSAICKKQYCNIEGIHFLNDEMLIGVSDKMKSKGKQDFWCLEKDQSVHIFVLP
jgi:hypothetical protein